MRALKRREPDAARAAMHEHLSRVIEDLLEVTEVEEMERARAVAAEKRRRYSVDANRPTPDALTESRCTDRIRLARPFFGVPA